ncbi:MAG: hypothetical protein ACD_60C00046G0001 [uncultured bacterium]|nr:MAG: hypothetical protein ACD_60C00046G0001 [uncultured bacterium]
MDDNKTLQSFQKPFAQSRQAIAEWRCDKSRGILLEDVIKNVHPTVLIGVSGQGGIFTENVIREMASVVARPIIFPLSNPTSRSEATPSDLMKWTNEQAIIGTGSPFGEIQKQGQSFRVDQTNNCYIFPGMGLGLVTAKVKMVTDNMFMAAAKALADCSPSCLNANANLLPPLSNIREVSLKVALAIAKEAFATGNTSLAPPANLEDYVRQHIWRPEYLPYKKG